MSVFVSICVSPAFPSLDACLFSEKEEDGGGGF